MQIIVAPYNLNDPNDPDWTVQPRNFEKSLSIKIGKSPFGKIDYSLLQTNHGLGADWPTVTFTIFSVAGLVIFGIPESHKKIRESIEEWAKIKSEIEKIINWLFKSEIIVQYPKELLYLDALTAALKDNRSSSEVVFLNMIEIEQLERFASGTNHFRQFLFSFSVENEIIQIAIDSERTLLWKNIIKIPKSASPK